jgi:hypothetical protein
MKIDINFIIKIFNLQIKLVNKNDIVKLSKYQDYIPMYDIYSQKIYPISKQQIHYRLIDAHYRMINHEIYDWLTNLYNKNKNNKVLGPKFKYNLDVLKNYNIDVLIETSYTALYKYSPSLGLSISICKRNSFHRYIQHLKPYYSKLELIKLGQNMGLIKTTIDIESLIDQDVHYELCKKVSSNDVSIDEIIKHNQYIIDNNLQSWICFYSFTGSFLFNKYLRNITENNLIANNLLFGINTLVKYMENTPALINNYSIYRFIWDDSFLIDLHEGDIFVDNGFLSTTRDPFYSPGMTGYFGLILIKIKIPKNKKGVGLFIENFSLFPKEEEFLLPPYSKFKLLSKNKNFKYYHTVPEFQKLINRKYEFELIDIDYKEFKKNHKNNIILKNPTSATIIDNITINGIDRLTVIKEFVSLYSSDNKINLKINNSNIIYSFNYQWFDSTDAYGKFYYNKIKEGMHLFILDDIGYPYLNIELGQQMVVNYLNTLYYGANNTNINDNIINLIYHIGRIFNYKNALIWHNYKTFIEFKQNYNTDTHQFLHMRLYNDTIYKYLKHKDEYISQNSFISFEIGYWYLDEYFNKNITMTNLPDELKQSKTNKDLYIDIVEKRFDLYAKMMEQLDENIITKSYVTFNIYEKLKADGLIKYFKPDMEYSKSDILDDNFKLTFRQPLRRI